MVRKFVNGFRQSLKEVSVVGNDDKGSVIADKGGFEYVLGHHIQVVGRLIENKKVHGGEQQLGKGKSGFLSSRKNGDFLLYVVLIEEKTAEDTADFGTDIADGYVVYGFKYCFLSVQKGDLVLCEVAYGYFVSQSANAAACFQLSDYYLGKGGFSFAVLADKSDLFTSFNQYIEVFEYELVAVALVQLFYFYHNLAGMRCGWKTKPYCRGVGLIDLHSFQLFEHLDFGLHLLAFGSLVAETLYEFLGLGDLFLLIVELGDLLLSSLSEEFDVFGIIGLVIVYPAGCDFYGTVRDVVEEGSVMGNEDNGSVIAAKKVLQPLNGFDVEVIGRLVEQ